MLCPLSGTDSSGGNQLKGPEEINVPFMLQEKTAEEEEEEEEAGCRLMLLEVSSDAVATVHTNRHKAVSRLWPLSGH